MHHLQLPRAAHCTETLKNNNKLHKNRAEGKCNRIFGCLFVNVNPSCFQSPFIFDTWYWQNYFTIHSMAKVGDHLP